jgi:Holliday junction resolvase RusA-like endonuclease
MRRMMKSRTTDIWNWPIQIEADSVLCAIATKGDPLPCPRPRVVSHGTYLPEKYMLYRAALAKALKEQLRPIRVSSSLWEEIAPTDRRFGVRALFYRRTHQRLDVDNLMKSVLDAGTTLIWPDDSQVVEIFARVFRGSSDPGADVLIYALPPDDLAKCGLCGKAFKGTRATQAYCSMVCRREAQVKNRLSGTCERCKATFTYPPSIARFNPLRFCSRFCNLAFYREKRLASWSPRLCADCGKRVSRKEYVRCRACAMAHGATKNISIYALVKE